MYINLEEENKIEKKYYPLYLKYNHGLYKIVKRDFLKKYRLLPFLIQKNNEVYLKKLKQLYKFLNNLDGYKLDEIQKNIVLSEEKNTLVIAGAGSGKTLTLVARIIYLLKKGVRPSEILCLTLTNKCASNLKEKLQKHHMKIEVLTFHKLGLAILRDNGYFFEIASDVLPKIIDDFITYNKVKDLVDVRFRIINGEEADEIISYMQTIIFKETNYYVYFKQTIITFINLFKNHNYSIDKFHDFLEKNNKENNYIKKRNEKYLYLLKTIYENYESYLQINNKIDFNDMINKAIKVLDMGTIKKYKYIIIDEYQDISWAKGMLIKKIQEKTDASILAIGDDWQSIYRFTGSDLSVFTDFAQHFRYTKIFKLNNTYRNSQELLTIMNKFIMKNQSQVKKDLISCKSIRTPLLIYYYEKNQKTVLTNILKKIKGNYLILGRNNDDINLLAKKYYKYFMTVHKAKGLEADKVIIVNLENSNLGFPNKIVDDDILKYVSIKDEYLYAEERRLFYVALTRTKTYNILLVNKNNPSIFVEELIKENKEYIKIMN